MHFTRVSHAVKAILLEYIHDDLLNERFYLAEDPRVAYHSQPLDKSLISDE